MGWCDHFDADGWIWVGFAIEAVVAGVGLWCPFLITGCQLFDWFFFWADWQVTVWVVEPFEVFLPQWWWLICSCGLYVYADELMVMCVAGSDLLVIKDLGGIYIVVKLEVVWDFGVCVVVIRWLVSVLDVLQVIMVIEVLGWFGWLVDFTFYRVMLLDEVKVLYSEE